MSSEHALQREKKSASVKRVCVSVDEWCASTGISKPTAYRWMTSGRLRYVQLGERMRKIPISEYARLGLLPTEAA